MRHARQGDRVGGSGGSAAGAGAAATVGLLSEVEQAVLEEGRKALSAIQVTVVLQ